MRKEIKTLLCLIGISILSCQNSVQKNTNLLIRNESNIINDTLKKLNFDNGLKVLLYRNLDDNLKHLVFYKNDSLISEKSIPTSLDYNGFSLDVLIKEGDYLLLGTEHGSINYYQTNFYFSLSEITPFTLEKLKGKKFNKTNPDKWTEKDTILSNSIPIENFKFEYFLDNGW